MEVIYGRLLKIKKDRNILFKRFIDIAVRSYIETRNFEPDYERRKNNV
jgi:hypothetical protein